MTYFNAHHIERNSLVAFDWIKLSAEQGNAEAQFRLAELYSLGLDIPKSHTDAYKWYTKAAIQGCKKALVRIHNLYQEDIRIHSRGKLDSQENLREKPKNDEDEEDEKTEYYYRELYEQRLDDHKLVLNHAIKYYTDQLEKYKSSSQEDPEVQQNLGFLYQHGYGVKKYEKWAIEYYTKAAEQGYVDSQYQLGSLYQKNTDIKFNYKKAYHWYCLAATGGNIAAQNHLGFFYEKGLGTNIDYTQALYWYTKAAESGHSMAQLALGKWYRKGCYVGVDYSMAVKWYTLAARQGNSVAQNCLVQLYQKEKIRGTPYESDILHYSKDGSKEGRLCSKIQADILKINDQLLVKNLKKLAKRALMGDGSAMYEVGLKYYNGTDFNENKLIAFRWIKNAADTGYKDALLKIIEMYEEGGTVQQDFHKVAIWTKKHARQKNDIAQCSLGILYNEGRGVRNDPLEASRWFTISADQGNSEAQYQLGCLRQTGRGLNKNEEEALGLFNSLAKKGDINGCYALGMIYSDGNRFKIDQTTALNLLEYSAKRGNEYAQFEMWIYCSKIEDKTKTDFYFNLLICSKNPEIIDGTLKYSMINEDLIIDNIKYFDYLKQAANLGIPLAKEVFQIPPTNIMKEFFEKMLSMFILVSEKGISSMEYHTGYFLEFLLDIDNTVDEDDDELHDLLLQCYFTSAEKGDSRAQVRLGVIYEEGKNVTTDFEEALNYYNLAYKKGNQDAMYRLACMYLDGRGVSQDLEKAFELFVQASDMGHIEARKVLMLPYNTLDEDSPEYKYYQHLAVKVNDNNRITMLEIMAKSGLVAIQYQLGDFYENKDDLKAVHWFTLAARGGVTDAYYRLGVHYENGRGTKKDYSQAIGCFEMAVVNEHEHAMYRLAEIYLYGKGVEISYSKAYQLYSRAAILGHTLSSRAIGLGSITDNYQDANYISKEKVKILINPSSNQSKHVLLMFQHVATEGDVDLQYRLGVVYERIFDTPNYEEAAKWYSMAANNSHREAMYCLGLLFEAGTGVTQDYQKAIQLYDQAYKLGDYDALYRLGTIYHHGNYVDIDYKKAIQFYKEAADNGHLESQHALGMLYEKDSFIERNILEALRWYTQAYLKGHDPARANLYAMYNDTPYEKYFFNRLNKFLLSVYKRFHLFGLDKFGLSYGFIFYRLGIQYLYGNGILQDYKESLKCFKIASDKFKNSTARDILNMKYRNDRDLFLKVIDMYERLFSTLESSQQYSLAMVYYNGVFDTTKNCIENPDPVNNKNTGPTFDEGNNEQNVVLATNYKKAISLLKNIQGDHCNKAHIQLAKMYTHGHGVEKNVEKVIEHYIKASSDQPNYYAFEIAQIYHFDTSFCDFAKAIEWYERTDGYKKGAALNVLGLIYKSGKGVDQDYEKSLRYFTDSAAKAFGESGKYPCYNLGLMYYHGKGAEQNYAEAYEYFKKATGQSHIKARAYLVNMYQNGYGVEKNIKKAKKIYQKTFDDTYNDENIEIADVSDFMYGSEAIEWLKKIEDSDPVITLGEIDFSDIGEYIMEPSSNHRDYKDISCFLGEMYYKGDGVQIDYSQAYTYFMKAAKAGHSEAQVMLAEMYTYGHGVDKNIDKVFEWYTEAFKDKPNRYALEIARIYKNNDDFCDYAKAFEWYIKASENDPGAAAAPLGELYHFYDKVQDFSKAFDWYRKVQESDISKSYALRGIGLLFEHGDGVNQDYKKSIEYYQQSVDQENKGGFYNLALMYYYGKGVEQNFKKCFDLLKESVKEDLLSGCTYVFVRTKDNLAVNIADKNRVYSLKDETVLYGEVYFQLGIMHKHGQGTPQDDNKAKECFLNAIEYGNEQAKYQIE